MIDPVTIALTVVFWSSFGALLLCACCIVRYSMRWSNNAMQNQPAVLPTQACQKNDTLHEKLIRQFKDGLKMLKMSGSLTHPNVQNEGAEGCPICFDEYAGPKQEVFIGYIKKCGHYFHFDCIWMWLEARGSCPLCREKVQLTEEDIKGLALSQVPKTRSVCTMTDNDLVESSSGQLITDKDSSSVIILIGRVSQGSRRDKLSVSSDTEVNEGHRSVGSMTEETPSCTQTDSIVNPCSCGENSSIVEIELQGTVNDGFEDDSGIVMEASHL